MATTQQPQADFVKAISRLDATALVVGSMIGSGIFIVSAEILREVHTPGLLLLVWGLSGVVTLMGALTYGSWPPCSRTRAASTSTCAKASRRSSATSTDGPCS